MKELKDMVRQQGRVRKRKLSPSEVAQRAMERQATQIIQAGATSYAWGQSGATPPKSATESVKLMREQTRFQGERGSGSPRRSPEKVERLRTHQQLLTQQGFYQKAGRTPIRL